MNHAPFVRTKYTRDIINRGMSVYRHVQRERLWVNGDGEEKWVVEIPWCPQHEFDKKVGNK